VNEGTSNESGREPDCRLARLLEADRAGRADSRQELSTVLYGELRALAAHYLAKERDAQSLQPTALVHEAWLRLGGAAIQNAESRTHFRALSALAMQRILVDHARARRAPKRGGDRVKEPLREEPAADVAGLDVVELDDALAELARRDARQAEVVRLRFFGGLTDEEIGSLLGVTSRTVRNDWRFARAWLRAKLAPEDE
jgi:RNA polymerase sigma factor (TIGR02999 family)